MDPAQHEVEEKVIVNPDMQILLMEIKFRLKLGSTNTFVRDMRLECLVV